MARFLDRLGRNAARHHWWFIGAWLVAAVLCVVHRGRPRRPDQRHLHDPGRPVADRRSTCSKRDFPSQAGATATVVFDAPQGLDDPQVQSAIQASIANLEKLPHVASVGNLITSKIAPFAGKIALVTVQYDTQAQDVGLDAYNLLRQATAAGRAGGSRARVRRRGRRLLEPHAVGQRRPHRSPGRGDHPAVRVRVGGRDGTPDPHRAVRSRRRGRADQHRRRRSPRSDPSHPRSPR